HMRSKRDLSSDVCSSDLISHIISGRNKPSLEFIMKINEAFPEIDLYWLMGVSNTDKHNTLPHPASETTPVSSPQPEGRKIALKRSEERRVEKEKTLNKRI